MKNILTTAYLFVFILIFSCQQQPKDNEVENSTTDYFDWHLIADKLIERSQLQPDEQIILVAQPGRFDQLVPFIKAGIEKAGASYLGTVSVNSIQPTSWVTEFTTSLAQADDVERQRLLTGVDLGIMLPGATPNDKTYAGLQEVLKLGKSRTIHFHWAGAYDLNGKLQETDSAIDVFYQNVLLSTDYYGLAASQVAFENAMREKWIQVTTPAGTDIKFRIGARQVTKQDGDAALSHMEQARTLIDREIEFPSGAIRVAPLEETVSGTVAFPDSEWNGKLVKGLIMTFDKGKVVEVIAKENLEAVQLEMENAGESGKSFREFALGFNPLLAIPEEKPWIPYYGYGAGVVRLSLGDNSELGGNVSGGYVRWNFFIDASVRVGEDIWVENGKLIK